MPESVMTLPRLAFWLLPEAEHCQVLSAVIAGLAGRFDAPLFAPHLTLATGRRLPSGEDVALLARLARGQGPLQLPVNGMATTAALTKTLFLRCTGTPELLALRRLVSTGVAPPSADPFDPHLSLLYHPLPETTRRQVVATTPLPLAAIRFDALQLVAIPERNDSASAIRRWQPLATCRFAGPASCQRSGTG